MRLSILHKGLILVSIPLVFEIIFVVVLINQLDESARALKAEMRSQDVIVSVETILKEIADSVTTGIIYNVTRDQKVLEHNQASLDNMKTHCAKLNRLVKHDDDQRRRAANFTDSAVNFWMKLIQSKMMAPPADKMSTFFEIRRPEEMQALLVMKSGGPAREIIETEKMQQSSQPALRQKMIFQIHVLLIFGAIVNITITVILGMYFARYVKFRLDNVLANTFKLGARMQLNPPLRGNDEIAELDQALHASATELLEFETFKEQLIGVVSHEMRSPLTSIQGTLTLLEAGAMGEFSDNALEEIHKTQENLDKLIALVNNLLLLERLEGGSQVIEEETLNLKELLESAREQKKDLLEPLGITVHLSQEDVTVVADPGLIELAAASLLDNSIARSPGNGQIWMIAREEKDSIELVVKDEGLSMDADQISQLLTRSGHKLDDDSNASASEVLAMKLCKAIITAHGGSIASKSDESFTSITCRLPYRRKSDD